MDWKELLAELGSHGLRQPQIAARCACSQATISDLACGKTKDPRYTLGESLRSLHSELLGAPGAPAVEQKESANA